jgi:hypothetical protein
MANGMNLYFSLMPGESCIEMRRDAQSSRLSLNAIYLIREDRAMMLFVPSSSAFAILVF